jgi:hypothetical protein
MKSIDPGSSLVAVAAGATLTPGMFCEPNVRRAYQAGGKGDTRAPDSIYCCCHRAESPFLVI